MRCPKSRRICLRRLFSTNCIVIDRRSVVCTLECADSWADRRKRAAKSVSSVYQRFFTARFSLHRVRTVRDEDLKKHTEVGDQ